VQEPIPIAAVNTKHRPAAIGGILRPEPAGKVPADTAGQLIDKNGASEFLNELEKEVEHDTER
jgi:hypothetical protein